MSNKLTGVALATAAAALFATGAVMAPLAHAAEEGKVKCEGVNSCKGTSECATAKSSCKGQGWVNKASKEECEKAGGKVAMDKKM